MQADFRSAKATVPGLRDPRHWWLLCAPRLVCGMGGFLGGGLIEAGAACPAAASRLCVQQAASEVDGAHVSAVLAAVQCLLAVVLGA